MGYFGEVSILKKKPVWIRYEDKSGAITERVIEIYRPSDDEVIYSWCRRKQAPHTFVRRNIHQWRLLPEHFDFDPVVAQYWTRKGLAIGQKKFPGDAGCGDSRRKSPTGTSNLG